MACTYYFSIILLQSRSNTLFKGKMLQNICLGNESFITDDISSYEIQIDISIYVYPSIWPTYQTIQLLTYLPIINQLVTYLYLSTQSLTCLTLCDRTDCSPQISSLHGNFQAKNTGAGCHFLLQEPDPGIEPTSPASPLSAGGFFTTASPGKPIYHLLNPCIK